MAHPDTGLLAGMTTYRMYVTTPNANDVISAIYGEEEVPLVISTTTSFFQSEFRVSSGRESTQPSFHFLHRLNSTLGDHWVGRPGRPRRSAPSWEKPTTAGRPILKRAWTC